MTEAELEALIMAKKSNEDARFILGKLMLEGTSDKVARNDNKGLNWLKECTKKGHLDAIEYKTYWDIRFDKTPKLDKITQNLEKVIEANKSTRALNTLAELSHATGSGAINHENPEMRAQAETKAKEAAKFYLMSSEQGCVVGTHWIGVFYYEGFGVTQNLDKAIEFLKKAAAGGNGQSLYQLYLIFSGVKAESKKDIPTAYNYLMEAIKVGVTYFEEAIKFFKENYDALAPVYVNSKGLPFEVKEENKKDILNMHEAMIGELKVSFSAALGKDRLYHRPCGFINDQQIWMVGVHI
mmetsp:Transcript_5537/g.8699  ORF Transcript_5537/g.8699 Transcript_5537/m.8699 type:complete len:296 (+) Transcript_5537:118-1005(+)